ncbi:MAG: hypothetical protein IKT57_08250 [Clostridia bacterium]|nr:hypothetical protein [Clostridia bacterium]
MTDLPLFRAQKGTYITLLLFFLLFMACFTPFSLWSLMVLYMVGCVALCTIAKNQGIVPAGICLLFSLGGMYVVFGAPGAYVTAGYLLPTFLMYLLLKARKAKPLYAAPALILCQLLSQTAIFLLLNARVGGELFFKAGESVAALLADNELGDMVLISMANYGLLPLSSELAKDAVTLAENGTYMLSAAAKAELLLAVRMLAENLLTALLPGMLISHSVETGLLCWLWPRHRAERNAMSAEEKQQEKFRRRSGRVFDLPEEPATLEATLKEKRIPHISLWHLPRPWGLRIGILGLGYFLISSDNTAFAMLGQMFYSLFTVVFSIQGLATLNFVQQKKGSRYQWRVGLPIVLTLAFPNTLIILGLLDQLTNMRMLRPLRRPPDDENHYPFDDDDDINP